MPKNIIVKDKEFTPYIPAEKIHERVKEMAAEVRSRNPEKHPVFIVILNGAFMFAADLMKVLQQDCEITFVKLSSYDGLATSGDVNSVIGLEIDIEGRDVIILEDIIDTGITMKYFLKSLEEHKPASVSVMTLLLKREALQHDLDIQYIGFEIPNKFVVGYGLDYDQIGRNWADIYQLVED